MSATLRSPAFFSHRLALCAVLIAGLGLSLLLLRQARNSEQARIAAELSRRADVHHTLVREVFSQYDDALFGLRSLFVVNSTVSRDDFARATDPLAARHPGVRAFEWVAAVARENRPASETALSRDYARNGLRFTELDSAGQLAAAADRPEYYPIACIEPLAGNERALGYDLKTGPTVSSLELARQNRAFVLTRSVPLVQEVGSGKFGVIMIRSVYREIGGTEKFIGFVQGVLHLPEVFAAVETRHPDPVLEELVLDSSEPDPARQVLYYHGAGGTSVPSETEFRRTLSGEQLLSIGGREWRLLYRPRAGWMHEQLTDVPWTRAGSVLLVTGLLAGLLHAFGRRTQLVAREVVERTADLRATQARLEEDVRRRTAAESALRESQRQLDSLMHSLPGVVYRCRYDKHLSVVFVSEGAFALTGATPEDFLQGRVHFRELIHPADLERVRASTREAIASRRDMEAEYRLNARDGREKWVLSRARGVYDANDKLQFLEGLAIDITAQKKAEIEGIALERKLLEGQKLESLGLLAGGVAHDFNNLLTAILGNAGLARLSIPASAVSAETALRQIEIASQRAAELCRQMLAYAGKGRFVVEPTDLSLLIDGLRPLLKISVSHRATLTLDLASRLPAVMADGTQLRQIAMNLVINASESLGDHGGEIAVSTGLMRADAATFATAVAGSELSPGEYIYLEIRDTGHGMTPDVLAKIFDPFFTTKFTGRGLGLAAALGIVRGHGGALRVESAPGRGTKFRLLLPPVPVASAQSQASNSATPWRTTARALIIDDDEPVREVTAAMLQSFGFKTKEAPHGRAGLALFREDPSYDVIVLDLLMPELDGEATLLGLRELRSDVCVLIMSGYHEGDLLKRHAGGGPLGYLHKPFKRGALERAIRDLLG